MVTELTGYGKQRGSYDAKASVPAGEQSPECHLYIDAARSTAVIAIRGEIDFVSTPTLQAAIGEAVAARPDRVLIDATGAEFISVGGYWVIGKLSETVDRVTLCSRSGLAERVMGVLGFPHVVCVAR